MPSVGPRCWVWLAAKRGCSCSATTSSPAAPPAARFAGNGKFIRQPLYAGDFCDIILSAIDQPRPGQSFDISGRDKIFYIDLIRAVKAAVVAGAALVKVPTLSSGSC